jgi:hypothetical protein
MATAGCENEKRDRKITKTIILPNVVFITLAIKGGIL